MLLPDSTVAANACARSTGISSCDAANLSSSRASLARPSGAHSLWGTLLLEMSTNAFGCVDRCAQILGSYRAIPRHVRRAVARECERFVHSHIETGRSFAVETTLRTKAAIDQAQLARTRGFATEMIFVATDSIEEKPTRMRRTRRAAHTRDGVRIEIPLLRVSTPRARTPARTRRRTSQNRSAGCAPCAQRPRSHSGEPPSRLG